MLIALVAAGAAACSGAPTTATVTPSTLASSTVTPTITLVPTVPPSAAAPADSSAGPTSAPPPTLAAVLTPATAMGTTTEGSATSPGELSEIALGYVTHLSEELGPRESATQQELNAAEYLAAQLEGFGYSVELQPFTIETVSAELSGLVLDGSELQGLDAEPLVQSATGDVLAGLVAVGLAREEDIPAAGLQGKIAFTERGLVTFQEKVNWAAEAGALGVIIYNNLPGNFRGFLARGAPIPVVSISREDGRRIEQLLSAGPVEVSVSVMAVERASRNVVAEKPGSGDKVVVLGGHYDTVPDVPGANDNASGIGVLLAIAQELAQKSLPYTVRFIAFGSEELGLNGSRDYVDSLTEVQLDRIRAMFNFDALGTGPQVGVLGDAQLAGLAVEQASALRIDVARSAGLQGGGSDHMSFSVVGIPVLMFFAGDFSRLHTPQDTLEFVVPGLLGDSAALALAILHSEDFWGSSQLASPVGILGENSWPGP